MPKTLSVSRPSLLTVTAVTTALAIASLGTALQAQAGDTRPVPQASSTMKLRPLPPKPAKEVFVRSKPHVNVGTVGHSKLKKRPGRPKGPGGISAKPHELADWYCGEGAGPGGHAVCTDKLIASCSGKYVPPKTNGEHQTWGMCHESTG